MTETTKQIIDLIKDQPAITIMATPRGKIRMVASDKKFNWYLKSSDPKKRRRAEKIKDYFDWCTAVQWLAKEKKYEIGDVIAVEFHLPFPPSYNKKKREKLAGQPHLLKPDTDNMLKALVDALAKSDSHIWLKIAWKVWTDGNGKMVIYKI